MTTRTAASMHGHDHGHGDHDHDWAPWRYVLLLVPIILFGVLWITTPSYLPPLLENPTGQKMLIYAVVMMIVAVFWMRKIIRIDL